MTRMISKVVFLLLLLPGMGLEAADTPAPAAQTALFEPGGRMGVHGMIVFGGSRGNRFISHIPMFHAPHDIQAIFRVSFDSKLGSFDKALYTFEPERFSLNDLLLGKLTSIHGSLFEGNFEDGGRLVETLEIRIDEIVRVSTLSTELASSSDLEYLAVGNADAPFLVHLISAPPDFDQIVVATIAKWSDASPSVERGVTLRIGKLANRVENRLGPGTYSAFTTGSAQPFAIKVDRVLSTLVGPDFVAAP